MIGNAVLFAIGLVIAFQALRDVFDTVAVPGGSRARLKVVRRLVWLALPLWKRLRREGAVTTSFAPLVLVLSFVVWMTLLAVGFGLMTYAFRDAFKPPLLGLDDAIFLTGRSMVTLGFSETIATGFVRWIVLAGGFAGLGAMTLAITYLLEVQSGIGGRDAGIVKLNTAAGNPPSAVRLLEKSHDIGNTSRLPEVLRDARNWCATVRTSHTNRPSLIYFESIASGAGWPAALGALIDVALLFEHVLDDLELRGHALLLGQEARQLARDLSGLVGLEPVPQETSLEDAWAAVELLRSAGYRVRGEPEVETLRTRRRVAHACVAAIAQHLGKPAAQLLPV